MYCIAGADNAIVSFNVALRSKLLIGPATYSLAENPHYAAAFSNRHWNPAARRRARAATRTAGRTSRKAPANAGAATSDAAAASKHDDAMDSSEEEEVMAATAAAAAAAGAPALPPPAVAAMVEEWQDPATAEAAAAAAAEAPAAQRADGAEVARQGEAQRAPAVAVTQPSDSAPGSPMRAQVPATHGVEPGEPKAADSGAMPHGGSLEHNESASRGGHRKQDGQALRSARRPQEKSGRERARKLFDHNMDLDEWDLGHDDSWQPTQSRQSAGDKSPPWFSMLHCRRTWHGLLHFVC